MSVYYRWILVTELRFGTDFMASQQTSLNDLIAKFNIIAIFHLLACREWVSGFGFRFQRVFFCFFGWGGGGLFLDLEQQSVVTAVTEKKLLQFNKNANFFFTRCSWLQFLAVFISFLVYIFYFFFVCVSFARVSYCCCYYFLLLFCQAWCDSFVKVMTNCERFAFSRSSLYGTKFSLFVKWMWG